MKILKKLFRDPDTQIDDRLHDELGRTNVSKYAVSKKDFPAYRFVDLYHAIESIVASQKNLRTLESDNYEDLSGLIHDEKPNWGSRQINKSSRTAWMIGPEEEIFLPIDHYWFYDVSERGDSHTLIIRLRYKRIEESSTLEIAA